MRRGTVELELDDLTYLFDYEYSRRRPATRVDPAEGGVTPDKLTLVLDGYGGPIHVDVTEHMSDLKVTERLVSMAQAQEREIA